MSAADPSATPVNDLLDALAFAGRRFDDWQQRRQIAARQLDAIRQRYDDLRHRVGKAKDISTVTLRGLTPPEAGESPAAHSLRYWRFVSAEIERFADRDVLRLAQSHSLRDEVRERVKALSRKLRPDEVPDALPVARAVDDDLPPIPARRETAPSGPGVLESLLDPRNIQYLLALGGALMVIGVVILLWVNNFFTPALAAGGLAGANALAWLLGVYLLRGTRLHTAGRALALLACLVMPLNLWYLNTHADAIGDWARLDADLWTVAAGIAALYLLSALILADETFVFVSAAGLTLAGLLGIASYPPSPAHFWGIAAPSTLLVALGLIMIHLERAFNDGEGPFTRKRFGLAFFICGHLELGAGLALLLGAFVYGDWLRAPFEQVMKLDGQLKYVAPSVVGENLWLSLVLIAAGIYAYVYSDLVVRHVGIYVHVAAFLLMWLLVVLIRFLKIELTVEALMAVLAGAALLINLPHMLTPGGSKYTRALPILGVLLPLAAVLIGVAVYFSHVRVHLDQPGIWATAEPTWPFVGALALTAVSCRVGAWVYRNDLPALSAVYHFATAAATMTGLAALLSVLGIARWADHAPLLMLVPIAYVIAAKLYQGGPSEGPLIAVAHAATVVMLIASMTASMQGFTTPLREQPLNVMMTLFFGEVALFYALTATLHKQVPGVVFGSMAGCAAVWQLFNYFGLPPEAYTSVFAAAGLGLLLVYRVAQVESLKGPVSYAAFVVGNVLLTLAFVSTGLMGLSRLESQQETPWRYIALCGAMTLASLLAVALVPERGWRRWYVVATIGMAGLTFLALTLLSGLTPLQKVEVFFVAIGLLMLLVSHIGWLREQAEERESDLVTLGMLLGSLAVGVPLAVATIDDRLHERMVWWNELGWLIAALVLFVSGFVFRLKATTLVGGVLLVMYLGSLVVLLPWQKLNGVALALTIGGGSIFALGLILSVFREALLRMPERVRKREGVFGVLNWR